MRAIGYRRASTAEQHASGLGLDAQTSAIETACETRGWTLVGVEEDIASGGRRDRPGLARALQAIESGSADVVVVSRLDRLGRSVAHVAGILERHPGSVVALDVGMTPDSPAGAFTAHVVVAAAELERALIRERTRDALRAARERGVRLGRPPETSADAVDRIRELHAEGVCVAHIARTLREEGVPTARGGRWHSNTVGKVLRRLDAA
jgi:DNA invertase Pin-like site-specific DNA recombinase